jgi:5,10-methylenetetrahydromethanopterin reductase
MKISIGIPSPIPPDVVVETVRYLESRGIEGCFSHEHLEPFVRDVFVILSLIAANSERITFGPNIVNPYTRHPAQVARAIATLDEISNGRAYLQWGVGHMHAITATLGIPHERFLAHMRDAVEISKLILSGHMPPGMEPPIAEEYKINYKGKIFQFMDNVVLPSRKVPVALCSNGPKMLQLAGEIADEAYIGHHTDPEGDIWALEQVAIGAAKSNRTLDDITIKKGIHVTVWPDRQIALDTIAMVGMSMLTMRPAYRKAMGIKLPFEKEPGDVMNPESEVYEKWAGKTTMQITSELRALVPMETQLRFCVGGTPEDVIRQITRFYHPRHDALFLVPIPPRPWAKNYPITVKLLVEEVVPAVRAHAKRQGSWREKTV